MFGLLIYLIHVFQQCSLFFYLSEITFYSVKTRDTGTLGEKNISSLALKP